MEEPEWTAATVAFAVFGLLAWAAVLGAAACAGALWFAGWLG